MAYTQDDLNRIRQAIARGEREVQFADRRVAYRSVSELQEAERHIARSLSPRSKQTYLTGSKGLD
jgi:hypothetical protein